MTVTPLTPRSTKKRKAAGTKRELQEVHHWRDKGYVAFRTPASMGVCDVIAMRRVVGHDEHLPYKPTLYDGAIEFPAQAELVFIEVKANLGNPFMNFRKLDREALKISARLAGATPLLVHHPPNGERREIPASEWPAA